MNRRRTIAALLALAAGVPVSADTVHLRRFERIDPYQKLQVNWGDKAYTYMDVADTYLSAKHPDDNFGAARTLRLQPGRRDVLLLQFGQLNRAVWRGARLTGVKLILRPVEGRFTKGVPISVYRVLREWRDGGADGDPMYWTATYSAAMSSPKANGAKWQNPGGRGSEDRASQPSLRTLTSAGYDPATNSWTLSSEGMLEDVRYWLGRQYRNYGWAIEMADPNSARGPVEVYSSDSMDKALRPELVLEYEPLLSEGDRKGVDLNVTFISRTPRYLRYHDDGETSYERKRYRDDNPGIMKFPVNGDTQKWPKKGDLMTYTATLKNSGFAPYRGKADFVWRLNGTVVRRGTIDLALAPEASVVERIQLPWTGELSDIRDEKLEFEIDPAGKIPEITKNNNAQSKYVKARTWKYWVEKTPYEYARQFMTAYGSYSFEDYLKWHEQIWNETFLDKSRFDGLAPDGSFQRITLDDFEVVADGRLGGGIHRLDDKPDFHFDGEWGTEWLKGEQLKDPAALANAQNFIRATRVLLEGSLIHEATHQVLGDFDQYWSNIEPTTPNKAEGKNAVKDGTSTYVTRGSMYPFPGLMGGDDTRPNEHYEESTGLYSAHSIIGYNANTPYRNGFFGEWQYDLPKSVCVRLLAADGTPIPGAKVKIWQFSGMRITDKNVVAEGLTADSSGVLKLPDQDSGEAADVTTATGHTMLKRNPFGRIEVVGTNTVLFLKVEAFGQTEWAFVRCMELNRAYAQGYRDAYTQDVKTQIAPARLDWAVNLAKGGAVQTVLNPLEAPRLTDGDRTTTWNGGSAPAGSTIQLDLGDGATVGAVRLVQSQGHGQFFHRFKIEVSNDPSFRVGVVELARQHPTTFGLAMTNDRDIDPANEAVRWVTYGARPTQGRYLRITNLADGSWATLAEIEAFGPAGTR